MNDLLKKIYFNKIAILFLLSICLGLYYFLISEMTLVEWLYSSKYIGLYINSFWFLFIVKRVNLYQTLHIPMRVRMNDEQYTKFLIQSFILHLSLYLILVYVPFMIGFSPNDLLYLLMKYFCSLLIVQLLNEFIIFFIIYKNLSNYLLSGVLIINFIFQFIVIEQLI